MNKSRKQFEEFIKFHLGDKVDENTFETANNELNYSYPYVDIMWITWKASRDGLDVELPQRNGICHNEYESGYFDAVDKCEDILIRNGVKIKNE